MTTVEAGLLVISMMCGWRFFPENWEFTKVVMLPGNVMLPLGMTIKVAPFAPLEGETKEEAEGRFSENLFKTLPSILHSKEEAEIAEATKNQPQLPPLLPPPGGQN